jgi:hypothetical protein
MSDEFASLDDLIRGSTGGLLCQAMYTWITCKQLQAVLLPIVVMIKLSIPCDHDIVCWRCLAHLHKSSSLPVSLTVALACVFVT